MRNLTTLASIALAVATLGATLAYAGDRQLAKYEPPEGKVLVFVGQDNASVGGQEDHSDGYVDHFGTPAGITHYIYFTEGKENPYGGKFDIGTVDGLNKETTWAAGPMCMRCYLESPKLQHTVIHLSISMEHDDVLDFAREKGKPVMLAEATARGFLMDQSNGSFIWTDWFRYFFAHIEQNSDVIKAISYINCDWDPQPMWIGKGWGNTRIQDKNGGRSLCSSTRRHV